MSLPRLSFSLSFPFSREANGFSASSAGSAMPWLGGSGAVAGRACAFAVDSPPGRVFGKPNFLDVVLLTFVSLPPTARLPFLSSAVIAYLFRSLQRCRTAELDQVLRERRPADIHPPSPSFSIPFRFSCQRMVSFFSKLDWIGDALAWRERSPGGGRWRVFDHSGAGTCGERSFACWFWLGIYRLRRRCARVARSQDAFHVPVRPCRTYLFGGPPLLLRNVFVSVRCAGAEVWSRE